MTLPVGYEIRDGKIFATMNMYSEEQAEKLKAYVDRAEQLLASVPEKHLVTVAKAIIELSGIMTEEAEQQFQCARPQRRRSSIGEIAAAANPDYFQPGVYEGQELTEEFIRKGKY
jgi:hypothetical protein